MARTLGANPESGTGRQAQRSADTRRRLCQAALDVLCEVGYESLTTPLIAARAGVSRGAQTHHFATKADLLVAAFEHLLQTWEDARQAGFGGTWHINGNTSIYADAERSFGGNWHKKWQWNLGINWQF